MRLLWTPASVLTAAAGLCRAEGNAPLLAATCIPALSLTLPSWVGR